MCRHSSSDTACQDVVSGESRFRDSRHCMCRRSVESRMLRVRARISWHFGASAGRADARRRDAGDVVTSSRSGNAADARPPPRPGGLRLPCLANYHSWLVMIQLGIGAAAKCQIILARALSWRSCHDSSKTRTYAARASACRNCHRPGNPKRIRPPAGFWHDRISTT